MSEERELFDQNKDNTKSNSNKNQIFLFGSKNSFKIALGQFLKHLLNFLRDLMKFGMHKVFQHNLERSQVELKLSCS